MSLHLYMGPMFSSKTSRLISEHQKWKCIDKPTLVINHVIDTRYGNDGFLYTHDKNKIPCLCVDNLEDVPDDLVSKSEAIFVNEGQFFTGLKKIVLRWCDELGKHVYIAGLDGDRHREKFGELLDLIPHADHYEKLSAKCKLCLDGTNAIFTYDLTNNDLDQIKVGTEQYLPLCRSHYIEKHPTKF